MKKILHYVSIMDRAGEETFIMNVFRTIDRDQYMFDFLVTENREGDYDKEINQYGGKIRHLDQIKVVGPLKRIKKFFLLRRTLKAFNNIYVAFHIHTQHAMDAVLDAMAAKLAGYKIVIVHSHSTSTLFHVKAHYVCRPLLNHLPIIRLACSQKAGRWLFGKKGKYEVINNGIVTENYLYNECARKSIRKKEGWEEKTVIGHVGNFLYPKNHEFIIDVFNSYIKIDPDALLVMAGKGELLDEIKKKVKDLQISENVCFLGNRGDVNQLYSAFDILLFPSHYEGLPVTLIEAQASDLPCLISDVITNETDIDTSLRRMSLNQGAEEWAKEIVNMLQKRTRGSNKERVIKAGFDISTTTQRLSEIYSE